MHSKVSLFYVWFGDNQLFTIGIYLKNIFI